MRHRGFATLFALTSVVLVAAALSAMAMAMHMEQQRTASARIQAAQRQLLLAGATDLAERAKQWPAAVAPDQWNINLPDASSKLSVSTTPSGPDQVQATVEAIVELHHAQQIILLHREHNRWMIKHARLDS